MKIPSDFECHKLDELHRFYTGWLPMRLVPGAARFDALWAMHPAEYHEIEMFGRTGFTRRWQQAYGMDYFYTGRVNKALPVPVEWTPFLAWANEQVDECLNGMLLNWYDGKLGHHIGSHHDSTKSMINGSPIVTMSLGEDRIFRLHPSPQATGITKVDFEARHGAVFIMPYETNLAFKHEVPAFAKWTGRRISITLRAFEAQGS